MKKPVAILFILFAAVSCTEVPPTLSTIQISSLDGLPVRTDFINGNYASVFVFLAPDCPLSQNYTLTLNRLYENYIDSSVFFYGIIPGNSHPAEKVQEFASKYQIGYPVFFDHNLTLTKFLNATTTPEVFVASFDEKIIYHGAIDNWATALGDHRQVITEHYLDDALKSFVSRKEITIKETKPVGCLIERK